MTGGFHADLVLEGGGVKGIGLAGAYTTLAHAGYRMHRIAGTSAGAIVGALIAADMPPDRMEKIMKELDYNEFQDESSSIASATSARASGPLSTRHLRRRPPPQLARRAPHRTRKADLRRSKITEPDGSPGPDEQSVSARRPGVRCVPWPARRSPGTTTCTGSTPASNGRRRRAASMSIPLIYEPVQLECETEDGEKATSFLVDGGILSNYPIGIFDRTDGQPPRWPTFGLKLSAQPHTSPSRDSRSTDP